MINDNGKVSYAPGPGISFSLVSSPKQGNKHIMGFVSCRDYINDVIIAYYNGATCQYYDGKDTIDSNKLRLLITTGIQEAKIDEFVANLFAAKKVINMYEKLAKFKTKTTIKAVRHSDTKVKYCWLLRGPQEWMKSTHLVSMVTLITRVIVYNGGFDSLKNIDEVENRFKELCCSKLSSCDLQTYLPAAFPKFRMLMEKYDKLFRNESIAFWNPDKYKGSWHSSGGIYTLCKFATVSDKINHLMETTYSEYVKNREK